MNITIKRVIGGTGAEVVISHNLDPLNDDLDSIKRYMSELIDNLPIGLDRNSKTEEKDKSLLLKDLRTARQERDDTFEALLTEREKGKLQREAIDNLNKECASLHKELATLREERKDGVWVLASVHKETEAKLAAFEAAKSKIPDRPKAGKDSWYTSFRDDLQRALDWGQKGWNSAAAWEAQVSLDSLKIKPEAPKRKHINHPTKVCDALTRGLDEEG